MKFIALLICTGLVSGFVVAAGQTKAKTATLRYKDVAPILAKNCVGCHNSRFHAEGYDASNYAAVIKGGEHGKAIVPGKPESSLLVKYITGAKKPRMPKGKAPLPADQIKKLSTWIKQGAKK